MPNDAKIRSASRAVVMILLATSLCVATEAQAQKLPPLETHLNQAKPRLFSSISNIRSRIRRATVTP
jgi:hypothetical protein